MARTRRLHTLAAQHVALIRELRQVSRELQATAESMTLTLEQAREHLQALRSVRRWAQEVQAQGGDADDA
jgi:hypothetical protein